MLIKEALRLWNGRFGPTECAAGPCPNDVSHKKFGVVTYTMLTQTLGRIPKVDPPILDSNTPLV